MCAPSPSQARGPRDFHARGRECGGRADDSCIGRGIVARLLINRHWQPYASLHLAQGRSKVVATHRAARVQRPQRSRSRGEVSHWHFKLPPTGTSASAEAKRRKVACRTLLEICTRVCAALPAVLALLLTIIAASSAAARSCNDVDHVVRRHCAYRVVLRVRCNERC